MNSWQISLEAVKRLKSNSTVFDDGGDTEYHQLEDTESPGYNEFESEDSIGQHALKGLDVLNWSKSITPPCIIWSEAAREGRISLMRELLNRCPESVMDITPTTRETPLHLVVRHGHCVVVRWVIETLRRTTCYKDVINRKDCSGDTVLHLATYWKQLQTLKLLLEDSPTHSEMVEVNAKNNSGFTALDFLHVLPKGKEVDKEIEKILRRAGASRGKEIKIEQKLDSYNNNEVRIELGKQWHRPLPQQANNSKYHGLLITATLFATMTFHAALRTPTIVSENFPNESSKDSEINHLFILFNSIAFFTSVALITFLTHELPLKPWLLISVSSTIGAYMCSIMVVSPHEVITVFFVGSFILLATFFKCVALDKLLVDYIQWVCTRIRAIY